MAIRIEESWKEILKSEFEEEYFKELTHFIKTEKAAGKIIYPPGSLFFRAFDKTPFHKIKVVILGQDPYHNPGQADGLSFSVPDGIRKPPSLRNIFKELKSDLGIETPENGNLESWAEEGVLLLNSSLSVRQGEPGSHGRAGWINFTDAIIKKISDEKRAVVFLLWGNFAQAKESIIDISKHFILKAPHPSPLSASRGFLGCKHFSKTNEILMQEGIQPVNWKLA
ncbi:MAG: uracil-DNA glycosylase [Ginsengibacter sp.]